MSDDPFDEVRVHIVYHDGGTEYLPRASEGRWSRWYAEWVLANEIACTGAYRGRAVARASIISI
jgi:hypothetical protein